MLHHHAQANIGRVALLAWKPTREAAHALAGSLPLLQKADKAHVAVWNEGEEENCRLVTLTDAQFNALVLGLPWQRLPEMQCITRA